MANDKWQMINGKWQMVNGRGKWMRKMDAFNRCDEMVEGQS